jgi:hypothetical protein
MAGALWGVALAAAFDRVRISALGKRAQLN